VNWFRSIFGQILHLFPKQDFFETVHATQAERSAKGFRCWDQFVTMLLCQLAHAHSLRDICDGVANCFGKAKQLGLHAVPKRSTLPFANEQRLWQLYEKAFSRLLARCWHLDFGKRRFQFRNKLFSLDATVIFALFQPL